jgi:acyl carrier protein phosphodiesterase
MNYLAHAYLSFDDKEILAGNIISDFVKGKKQFDYPWRIHAGIRLHRLIDDFTDQHIATREAKEFFRPSYRLYSGAFIDVVYDHFLATDETEFTDSSLMSFSERVYDSLENNSKWLPPRFAAMFPFMRSQNWLYHYGSMPGIEKSFHGIARRATYIHESDTAFRLFRKYYQPLQQCYRQFWKDVKQYAFGQFELLRSS